MKRLPLGRGVFLTLIALIYAFIILPIVIVLVAAVSTTPYLTFPPAGFTLRWFRDIVLLYEFTDALWTSLEAAAATLLALTLGTWITLALRRRFPGRDALQGVGALRWPAGDGRMSPHFFGPGRPGAAHTQCRSPSPHSEDVVQGAELAGL